MFIVSEKESWFKQKNRMYYTNQCKETLLSELRASVLASLLVDALELKGEIWECGVYKGGSAGMFAFIMQDLKKSYKLRLFDTFSGIPDITEGMDPADYVGMFEDTSEKQVRERIKKIYPKTFVHGGYIPDTFVDLEDSVISFAHIDTDTYKSYIDCLNFIWPRLVVGGIMVFDDYGWCPGPKIAVDEFFADKVDKAFELDTHQAIVIKTHT